MKRISLIFTALCAAVLYSCSAGDMYEYVKNGDYAAADYSPDTQSFNAIVTVKQDQEGKVYFQLDDSHVLYPRRYPETFNGIRRIICGIETYANTNECAVLWMDYLEEGTVASEANGVQDDGLDLISDWMTSVEDGFLTVHYDAFWGSGNVAHKLIVTPGTDPYSINLIHSANGDEALEKGDALIYFDINSLLPDTEGAYKTLTLSWKTCDNINASKTFQFRSRQ